MARPRRRTEGRRSETRPTHKPRFSATSCTAGLISRSKNTGPPHDRQHLLSPGLSRALCVFAAPKSPPETWGAREIQTHAHYTSIIQTGQHHILDGKTKCLWRHGKFCETNDRRLAKAYFARGSLARLPSLHFRRHYRTIRDKGHDQSQYARKGLERPHP